MTSGEPDFTKRVNVYLADAIVGVDHKKIKGVDLIDPNIAACVPISIENPAIAYDETNDRFKVDIVAQTLSEIAADITDDITRLLGIIDLAYVNGAALSHANPVIVRLTDGSAFMDPTQIRALTNSDVVTVEQATAASLKATVTQASSTRTVDDITKTVSWVDDEETDSGNTEIITVSAGQKLRVKFVAIWNNGAASITVGLRFTSTGGMFFKHKIASESGFMLNLVGANKEGGTDEDLFINLSDAGTVSYTVGYEEV